MESVVNSPFARLISRKLDIWKSRKNRCLYNRDDLPTIKEKFSCRIEKFHYRFRFFYLINIFGEKIRFCSAYSKIVTKFLEPASQFQRATLLFWQVDMIFFWIDFRHRVYIIDFAKIPRLSVYLYIWTWKSDTTLFRNRQYPRGDLTSDANAIQMITILHHHLWFS